MENKLTHFDSKGNAVMVDVSEKNITQRVAIAKGKIYVNKAVIEAIVNDTVEKGDVLVLSGGAQTFVNENREKKVIGGITRV